MLYRRDPIEILKNWDHVQDQFWSTESNAEEKKEKKIFYHLQLLMVCVENKSMHMLSMQQKMKLKVDFEQSTYYMLIFSIQTKTRI